MSGPNRFLCNGSPHVQGSFGSIIAIAHKHHVAGKGHVETLQVSCDNGLVLEITQAFAIELTRRLNEQLAALPALPDCAGAAWAGEVE
jgi:hypothetical protein